ncbi:MAG: asparagine synthetase B [Candidatus Latescibacterota bacterium]|nr:asparagine synthetase B [Candidatus Latescibacterota bacterium]
MRGSGVRAAIGAWALVAVLSSCACAERILIPMDLTQTNHLKAYGVAFWVLERDLPVEWLLNYRGGSFLVDEHHLIAREAQIRGVSTEAVSEASAALIYAEVDAANMEVVRLEKAPRIAVYTPPNTQPWDDAVTMALEYAQIDYEKLWDEEVLNGGLLEYDWLHLHHEDFSGQYGKFYASFRNEAWYRDQQQLYESMARRLGFAKVAEQKKAVTRKIHEYMSRGGFLFAMCSATDTFDISLAAAGVDIAAHVFDGDPADPAPQQKLDFERTVAFEGFTLEMNALVYEHSDIDTTPRDARLVRTAEAEYFTLFEFSAKYDPVPAMLTQCHTSVVNGFLGQTTGFRRHLIKDSVIVLAEVEGTEEVKYIHGSVGKGSFTFYGGHDPEDHKHHVGDPPTQLALFPNSPGYRLILNNILFPAAKKKERKT